MTNNQQDTLEMDLMIRKPSESVRRWWTNLPDDYHADDPTEQPFRIFTTKRMSNASRGLFGYWRLQDGSIRKVREIMEVKADGTWTFEIPSHPLGLRVFDEFSAKAILGGGVTMLHIRCVLSALEPNASARIPAQKERMKQVWRRAAEICERDAPSIL